MRLLALVAGLSLGALTSACAVVSGVNQYSEGCTEGCPDAGSPAILDASPDGTVSRDATTATDAGDAAGSADTSGSLPDAAPDGGDGGCATGMLVCPSGCFDPSDPRSCGACGVACSGPTPLCAAFGGVYSCTAPCPSSTATLCGGTCVETAADPKNCGKCGNVCTTTLANAQPACADGACTSACAPGYSLCSGACIRLTTASDCGACGHACTGATPLCALATGSAGGGGGDAGQDAGGDASDAGPAAGDSGGTDDAGDAAAIYACVSGCPAATPTLCGTTCVDEQTDPTACGGCGAAFACASGQTCSGGKCFGCGTQCPISAVSTDSCARGGCNASGGVCVASGAPCHCFQDSQCPGSKCARVTSGAGANSAACSGPGGSCTGGTDPSSSSIDGFDCVLQANGIPQAPTPAGPTYTCSAKGACPNDTMTTNVCSATSSCLCQRDADCGAGGKCGYVTGLGGNSVACGSAATCSGGSAGPFDGFDCLLGAGSAEVSATAGAGGGSAYACARGGCNDALGGTCTAAGHSCVCFQDSQCGTGGKCGFVASNSTACAGQSAGQCSGGTNAALLDGFDCLLGQGPEVSANETCASGTPSQSATAPYAAGTCVASAAAQCASGVLVNSPANGLCASSCASSDAVSCGALTATATTLALSPTSMGRYYALNGTGCSSANRANLCQCNGNASGCSGSPTPGTGSATCGSISNNNLCQHDVVNMAGANIKQSTGNFYTNRDYFVFSLTGLSARATVGAASLTWTTSNTGCQFDAKSSTQFPYTVFAPSTSIATLTNTAADTYTEAIFADLTAAAHTGAATYGTLNVAASNASQNTLTFGSSGLALLQSGAGSSIAMGGQYGGGAESTDGAYLMACLNSNAGTAPTLNITAYSCAVGGCNDVAGGGCTGSGAAHPCVCASDAECPGSGKCGVVTAGNIPGGDTAHHANDTACTGGSCTACGGGNAACSGAQIAKLDGFGCLLGAGSEPSIAPACGHGVPSTTTAGACLCSDDSQCGSGTCVAKDQQCTTGTCAAYTSQNVDARDCLVLASTSAPTFACAVGKCPGSSSATGPAGADCTASGQTCVCTDDSECGSGHCLALSGQNAAACANGHTCDPGLPAGAAADAHDCETLPATSSGAGGFACATTLQPTPVPSAGNVACICTGDADCPSGRCSNAGNQCTSTCTGSTVSGSFDRADCAIATSADTGWACSSGNCDDVTSPAGKCSAPGVPCWCTSDSQCSGGRCVAWAGCAAGACTGSGTPDGFHCVP
jgi:hypothetical protein